MGENTHRHRGLVQHALDLCHVPQVLDLQRLLLRIIPRGFRSLRRPLRARHRARRRGVGTRSPAARFWQSDADFRRKRTSRTSAPRTVGRASRAAMSSVAPGEPVPLATRAYWDDWYASKLAEEDAGDTPALEFEWLAGVGGEDEHGDEDASDGDALWSVIDATPRSSRVLELGCGVSRLAERMCDAGFERVDAIDFSDAPIAIMRARALRRRGSPSALSDSNRRKRKSLAFVRRRRRARARRVYLPGSFVRPDHGQGIAGRSAQRARPGAVARALACGG